MKIILALALALAAFALNAQTVALKSKTTLHPVAYWGTASGNALPAQFAPQDSVTYLVSPLRKVDGEGNPYSIFFLVAFDKNLDQVFEMALATYDFHETYAIVTTTAHNPITLGDRK